MKFTGLFNVGRLSKLLALFVAFILVLMVFAVLLQTASAQTSPLAISLQVQGNQTIATFGSGFNNVYHTQVPIVLKGMVEGWLRSWRARRVLRLVLPTEFTWIQTALNIFQLTRLYWRLNHILLTHLTLQRALDATIFHCT